MTARCHFTERITVAPGAPLPYRYRAADIRGYLGMNTLELDEAPAVGDTVTLASKTYRVIDRQWHYSEYGSANWPGGPRPNGPHSCDIIVERSSGGYVAEAELTEEEKEA